MFYPVLKSTIKRDTQPLFISASDDYALTTSESLDSLPIDGIVRSIELATLKASVLQALKDGDVLIDDAAINRGINKNGYLFTIGQSKQQSFWPVLEGSGWNSVASGAFQEVVNSHLLEKYGATGIAKFSFPLACVNYDSSELFLNSSNSTILSPLGCFVAEIELQSLGLDLPISPVLSDPERLITLCKEHQLMTAPNMEWILNNTKDVVNSGLMAPERGEQLSDAAYSVFKAYREDEKLRLAIADIYWQHQKVGHVAMRRSDRDMTTHFYEPELQKYFSVSSPEKKERTPSFIAQMLPGFIGDDQHTVLQTMRNGLHGLGNISIKTEELPLRPNDVKSIAISDASDNDDVYRGAIYGVIRPSMVEDNESLHLEPFQHQQYKNDRDEVAVSGNQPKTVVHIQKHGANYSVHHSGRQDNATHLLKIPKNALDKNSTLGGREWLSMTLARDMGLEVPSFAMVDLNQTTQQYVSAARLESDESDINVEAVDFKRQLFGSGVNIGDEIKSETIISDFESKAGSVIEPPGYAIELFCLPTKEELGRKKFYSMDFCMLLGLDTKQRFKGSMEDVCITMKKHSSDFGADSQELMKRFLCSWMLGDGDLHLKNVSMLLTDDNGRKECRLSPAYDILSMAGLSGYSVECALSVNGTRTPSIDDFVQVGMHYLDMHPDDIKSLCSEMAECALSRLTVFRGADSLSDNSRFPNIPDIARSHRATDRALRDMTHGIEMSLSLKNLLAIEDSRVIEERIEQENPSVYKESLTLFTGNSDRYTAKQQR